jgi:hypothetical protein
VPREDRRVVLALVLLGIVPKLVALPFAVTQEADAVARVWTAWRWLDQPAWIAHGVWGPLHTYLLAAALFVYSDPVVAPAIQNILFATATVLLLYALTRDAFGRRAGVIVAATYCLYPVVFRNSLMAVSEVPFAFFVVLALWLVSHAAASEWAPNAAAAATATGTAGGIGSAVGGRWAAALGAGLALTCACALRYEGWAAIPLLAVALRRRPRLLVLFVAAALVFPVVWMIGNQREFGDPLYGVHAAARHQIEVEGYNDDLTLARRIKRAVYYPVTLFLGLTPLVAIAVLGGLRRCLVRRPLPPWVVPGVGLLLLFIVQAARGELLLRGRYSIVLGALLLPCVGALYRANARRARVPWLELAVLAAMLPFSFLGARVAPRFLDSVFPNDIRAVPIPDATTRRLAAAVRANVDPDRDAFVCDFIGWQRSFGIALATRLHPDRILVAPGERGARVDAAELGALLRRYPAGVLLVRDGSPLSQALDAAARGLERQPLERVGEIAIERYRSGTPR